MSVPSAPRVKTGALRALAISLLVGAVVAAAVPSVVEAGHSWNNYHWARTSNPFTVQLGNNVTTDAWNTALGIASADWTASNGLDTTVVTGSGTCEQPTAGRIEVCNADYGKIGWLGLAQIWIYSDGHIAQGTAKMNDQYFNQSPYDTETWRQYVMCQEVGHDFGLGHTDETHSNANQGTCMDYTNDPDGGPGGASETDPNNMHPNKHDFDQLTKIYRHKDRFSSVAGASGSSAAPPGLSRAAAVNPSGPERGGVSVFEADLGGGNRQVTFVIWADADLLAAARANDRAPVGDGVEAEVPVDGDGDGLTDEREVALGTDPANADSDADGLLDGDEVLAGTDPLTADGVAAPSADAGFDVGAAVVTNDAVNLRAAPSRQADVVTELAAGTPLTVTGAAEEGQGLVWVPVVSSDGTLVGYVAADFLTPAA